MVPSQNGAQRPASQQQDATTPSAQPQLKLRDGTLTVTVFSKPNPKGDAQLFVVPERAYRDANKKWQTTHLLHPDDLLRMSALLQETYARLRQTAKTFESA